MSYFDSKNNIICINLNYSNNHSLNFLEKDPVCIKLLQITSFLLFLNYFFPILKLKNPNLMLYKYIMTIQSSLAYFYVFVTTF